MSLNNQAMGRSFDFPLNSSGLPPFRHRAYDWWEFERACILGKVMDQHGNWVDRPPFQGDWGIGGDMCDELYFIMLVARTARLVERHLRRELGRSDYEVIHRAVQQGADFIIDKQKFSLAKPI